MKLFGIIETAWRGTNHITDISTNINNYKESDNVYYTEKEKSDPFSVYNPYEENRDADWLPYSCIVVDYDIYCKDDKYYVEEDKPEGAVCGKLVNIYREGKLIKKYFEKYD